MPALRAFEPDDDGAPQRRVRDRDDLPHHGRRFDSILDATGYTPLVEIPRMSPNPAVRIFAKLDVKNRVGAALAFHGDGNGNGIKPFATVSSPSAPS